MAYTREQRHIARVFARELERAGASPRVQKALYAAGLVESNLRNVNYGDRDSLGVLQQRPSQGWGSPGQVTNPRYAARQFIDRAMAANRGFKGSAGDLAQAVQRSAFPDRYDERGPEADALRRRFLGGGAPTSGSRGPGRVPDMATPDPTELTGLLESLLPKRQAPQVSAPSAPGFAAKARGAGATPVSGSAGPARPKVEDLIRALGAELGPDTPSGVTQDGVKGGKPKPGPGLKAGGSYEGTTRLVRQLASLSGLKTSSGKRDTHLTASGNPSDHSRGVGNANARDLIGTEQEMKRGAAMIARELGIKEFRYGSDYNATLRLGGGTFRVQLITSPHGSGPHVHVGVKRVK